MKRSNSSAQAPADRKRDVFCTYCGNHSGRCFETQNKDEYCSFPECKDERPHLPSVHENKVPYFRHEVEKVFGYDVFQVFKVASNNRDRGANVSTDYRGANQGGGRNRTRDHGDRDRDDHDVRDNRGNRDNHGDRNDRGDHDRGGRGGGGRGGGRGNGARGPRNRGGKQ